MRIYRDALDELVEGRARLAALLSWSRGAECLDLMHRVPCVLMEFPWRLVVCKSSWDVGQRLYDALDCNMPGRVPYHLGQLSTALDADLAYFESCLMLDTPS